MTLLRFLSEPLKAYYHRLTLTPAYPVFGNFVLTWRCNYKCVMCNNWKKKTENELTAHELDELLNSKWLKKLEIVSLTGGEPFLRKDLEEIIDVFKKHKVPQIGITTNASLPERICDVLNKTARVSNSRFWLHISLDGRPEVHNRIRGVSTAYENVVKTILSVKSLGLKNLTIAVGICISNLNWNEINFVKNFAENFGVRLVVGLAESGWIFGQEGTGKNLYTFTEQEKEAIIRGMEEIGTWYSKGVIMRLNGVSKPIQCTAFWHGFTIAPNGDVHPCVNSNFVVGNIKETRFDEIWTCKQAKHARRIVKKCPGCWSNCEMIYSYRNSFQKILWSKLSISQTSNPCMLTHLPWRRYSMLYENCLESVLHVGSENCCKQSNKKIFSQS